MPILNMHTPVFFNQLVLHGNLMDRPPGNANQPGLCLHLESLEIGVGEVCAGKGKTLDPRSQQCWHPEMIIVSNTAGGFDSIVAVHY